jgi:hypothetical protein
MFSKPVKIAAFLMILFSCIWSCESREKYNPTRYLPLGEQKQFLNNIGRYIAKLPKRASHEQKFDSRYDEYYQEEMQKYKVQHYYISPDSTHFFLVNRPAPSLYEKRVAIGGRLKYNNKGGLVEYEEVFRTWKMKEDELTRKGEILFKTMVEKGNVNEYLPDKTQEDWVEFPDSRNFFDKTSRRWRTQGQNDSIFYVR